jgi:hypothetical protein
MALYPYVGTKDQLLALMQDHASAMPVWRDPTRGLANALEAWATALFELYLAHPWLTELPWSQASHGPNERDWMERLLRILDRWGVASPVRATAITMLYATVRACAQTAADYGRMDRAAIADWRANAEAIATHLPDLRDRYPLSTGLEPVTPDWRENPRAAVLAAIRLLTPALIP